MWELFNHSPHPVHLPDNKKEKGKKTVYVRGMYSEGEYDANHRVSIPGQSQTPHALPTRSYAKSRQIHASEADKINSPIECGEEITIKNITSYAQGVEFGGSNWSVPGYFTYTKAVSITQDIYGDILL
jgi:hypothetical protein